MPSLTTLPDIPDLRTDVRSQGMFVHCSELIQWIQEVIEGRTVTRGMHQVGGRRVGPSHWYLNIAKVIDRLGPATGTLRYGGFVLLDGGKRTWVRAAKDLPCPCNLVNMTRAEWIQQRQQESIKQRQRPLADKFCAHLGAPTNESVECGGCGGGLRTLFECNVYGTTLPFVRRKLLERSNINVQCCDGCDSYQARD